MITSFKTTGKSNKKFHYLKGFILPLILVGSLLYFFGFSKATVYFYKKGTDIPIANEYVKISHSPFCSMSPCKGSYQVYEGHTNKEGAIRLNRKHARQINKRLQFEQEYEYSINIPHFVRVGDYYGVLPASENRSKVTFMTEMKNPNQPIELDLGQEFFIGESPHEANFNTFQLSNIDAENEVVELTRLIGTDVGGKIKTLASFKIKKGEANYIPGQVTDSKFTLDSVNQKQAILHFTPSESTNTWADREVLDFSKHFQDNEKEMSYEEALDHLAKIESEYLNSQGTEIKLLPYYFAYGDLYAISPLGNQTNDCLDIKIRRFAPIIEETNQRSIDIRRHILPCSAGKIHFF